MTNQSMKKEKRSTKAILLTGLIQGLFFATAMALFDFFRDIPFSILQFLFYAIFFGGAMAFMFRYKVTKDKK